MMGTIEAALSAGATGVALVDGAAMFAAAPDANSGAGSAGFTAVLAALGANAPEVADRATGMLCFSCGWPVGTASLGADVEGLRATDAVGGTIAVAVVLNADGGIAGACAGGW